MDSIKDNTNLFIISKLRKDANARYLYDGKICWDDLNENHAFLVDETDDYHLYELTV